MHCFFQTLPNIQQQKITVIMRCDAQKSNAFNMKLVSVTILFLPFLQSGLTVSQARDAFFKSNISRTAAMKFSRLVDTATERGNPVLLCYKGASYMFKARYTSNPFYKLIFFNEGKLIIEKAIAKDSTCLESFFIRFTIQRNLPGFLGYRQNLSADSSKLRNGLYTLQDHDLKNRIRLFLDQLNAPTKTDNL